MFSQLLQQVQLVGGEVFFRPFTQQDTVDDDFVVQCFALDAGGIQLSLGFARIKAQQQIAGLHRLAFLHQHAVHHARQSCLHILDGLCRLKLSLHGHRFR